ncbi:GNAT family N-acetyltransferase [Micromonospora sp. M12]
MYAPKFTLLDAVFEALHPSEPHHYLAYVAVKPEQQNRGVGAALLSHYHRQLDVLGMPAYLEASNLRNRELYLLLGYRAGPPLILPTTGPTIWRMWRGQPDAAAPAGFPKSGPCLPGGPYDLRSDGSARTVWPARGCSGDRSPRGAGHRRRPDRRVAGTRPG